MTRNPKDQLSYDNKDTLASITRACGYIKDDAKIAAFYGVSVALVQRQRLKEPKHNPRSHNYGNMSDNSYYLSEGAMRKNSIKASSKLNELCWELYRKIAKREGLADAYDGAAFAGMAP